MSDLLLRARETLQEAFSDENNPAGLDGIEFVEYATANPQALGQVLEMMGFRAVSRHRSREVVLYRHGAVNIVVNADPAEAAAATDAGLPRISAIALRVRDARAAYARVLERGAWEVPTHPQAMELNIPAIHGVGGSRIYFVDRWRDFSIYDIDFVPITGVPAPAASVPGLHVFGIVQYIGLDRTSDWTHFYRELFGMQPAPNEQRFGIMPAGTLLHAPALASANRFMLQLIEPELDGAEGAEERLQRIGLGVADVPEAVRVLREAGMEFMETATVHTERRGALTRTYLGGAVFELVHSEAVGS